MPPTGRSFEADQIHIHRVRGGKITGHAATRNDLLMLNQLGLLPGIKPVSEASWRTQLTPVPATRLSQHDPAATAVMPARDGHPGRGSSRRVMRPSR